MEAICGYYYIMHILRAIFPPSEKKLTGGMPVRYVFNALLFALFIYYVYRIALVRIVHEKLRAFLHNYACVLAWIYSHAVYP